MDSSSQGSFSSSNNGASPSKKPPIETVDDYFKDQGIEPSSIKIDIEYGSPEEIRRAEQEEAHKRKMEFSKFLFKEASAYVIGFLLVITLASASMTVMLDQNSSTSEKDWAKSTLTGLATAVAGYVFGKSS